LQFSLQAASPETFGYTLVNLEELICIVRLENTLNSEVFVSFAGWVEITKFGSQDHQSEEFV